MKFAIVYDSWSPHKTTKRAAEQMARIAEEAGHDVYLVSVQEASVKKVRACDVICIGSWTQGFFFVLQHASKATMKFINELGPLRNQRACVFCTFKTSYGRMLKTMEEALREQGAVVSARFATRGAFADPNFVAWVQALMPPVPRSAMPTGLSEIGDSHDAETEDDERVDAGRKDVETADSV